MRFLTLKQIFFHCPGSISSASETKDVPLFYKQLAHFEFKCKNENFSSTLSAFDLTRASTNFSRTKLVPAVCILQCAARYKLVELFKTFCSVKFILILPIISSFSFARHCVRRCFTLSALQVFQREVLQGGWYSKL